jgi:ATP-dependent exoDNAse (exonuclease V) alpha subunit
MNTGTLITSGALLTTTVLRQQEASVLLAESNERHTLRSLMGGAVLGSSGKPLSPEQAKAVHHILGSRSRVVGIVGKAGTGKTTTLSTAVESLKSTGIKILGLAPSSSASRQLAEAGMTTATVSAFLHYNLGSKLGPRGVVIVDEAGMVSTKQMVGLISSAQQLDLRLVLVGDPGQLAAIEAGKPFGQLISAGLPTASLREVHWQLDEGLKLAVEHASNGRIHDAIATIKHRIIEVPARAERLEAVATAYSKLSPTQRAGTIVVSGTRASREQLNILIRTKLGLSDDGPKIRTLERKDLTKQLAASITSYEVGDVVIADRNYPSLQLRRGDHAKVVRVTPINVILSDVKGCQIVWSPALTTGLTVHRVVDRSIVARDLIRMTSNMHSEGLLNGDELKILEIDHEATNFTVTLSNGAKKQLDFSKPLPIDYAYCRTVYASQGATCERVFIEADTSSLTSNQGTFYVALSRARCEVAIFTDDAKHLAPAMAKSHQKSSAMDLTLHPRNVTLVKAFYAREASKNDKDGADALHVGGQAGDGQYDLEWTEQRGGGQVAGRGEANATQLDQCPVRGLTQKR